MVGYVRSVAGSRARPAQDGRTSRETGAEHRRSTVSSCRFPPSLRRRRGESRTASNNAYGKPAGQTFSGGVGAGARGSQGVTDATKSTPNSITYVEASFAQKAGLGIASIINAGTVTASWSPPPHWCSSWWSACPPPTR